MAEDAPGRAVRDCCFTFYDADHAEDCSLIQRRTELPAGRYVVDKDGIIQDGMYKGIQIAVPREHWSPAQKVMRSDMERVEEELMQQDPTLTRRQQEPVQLDSALDEVLGSSVKDDGSELSQYGQFLRQVPELALQIISTEPDLVMGLGQWRAVQNMVESAILRGYQEHA